MAQQRSELEAAIEHLKQDNHELNLRLAEIDTQRIGWARERGSKITCKACNGTGRVEAKTARAS